MKVIQWCLEKDKLKLFAKKSFNLSVNPTLFPIVKCLRSTHSSVAIPAQNFIKKLSVLNLREFINVDFPIPGPYAPKSDHKKNSYILSEYKHDAPNFKPVQAVEN